MINWLHSIDGWTWVKVACLMAFATCAGLLKRKMFDEELREANIQREREFREREHADRVSRFTDPFDN